MIRVLWVSIGCVVGFVVLGCNDTKYGGSTDPGWSGDASGGAAWTPEELASLRNSIRASGMNPDEGELGRGFRDAEMAAVATNPDYVKRAEARLEEALSAAGVKCVVNITNSTTHLRVYAHPLRDPNAVEQSMDLTAGCQLDLHCGKWIMWAQPEGTPLAEPIRRPKVPFKLHATQASVRVQELD